MEPQGNSKPQSEENDAGTNFSWVDIIWLDIHATWEVAPIQIIATRLPVPNPQSALFSSVVDCSGYHSRQEGIALEV